MIIACVDYVSPSTQEHHQSYAPVVSVYARGADGKTEPIRKGANLPLNGLVWFRDQVMEEPSN